MAFQIWIIWQVWSSIHKTEWILVKVSKDKFLRVINIEQGPVYPNSSVLIIYESLELPAAILEILPKFGSLTFVVTFSSYNVCVYLIKISYTCIEGNVARTKHNVSTEQIVWVILNILWFKKKENWGKHPEQMFVYILLNCSFETCDIIYLVCW